MLGAITLYTDDITPSAAGIANMFVVRIRPKYKPDKGLHEHEYTHVKQWYVTSLLFCSAIFLYCWQYAGMTLQDSGIYSVIGVLAYNMLYEFIPQFRLFCEVQAYKKQLEYYSDDRTVQFGKFISQAYDLDITAEKATQLLRK